MTKITELRNGRLTGRVFSHAREALDAVSEIHFERTGCLASFYNGKKHTCSKEATPRG